ncbi:hypothetical protein ABZ897_15935 [Nonomuraea sp. NPDC046802]|uniref:hypothetical protein n=1 Tax=Nonomuraea sp. NPDC046802 TaxID=3154919 RepID=UPI0033CB124F
MTSGHDDLQALATVLADAITRMNDNVEQQAQKLASERLNTARAQRARDASQALAGTENEWMAYNAEMARRILAQMEELGDLWRRRLLRGASPEDAARIGTAPSPEWTVTIASLLASIAAQRVEGKMDVIQFDVR